MLHSAPNGMTIGMHVEIAREMVFGVLILVDSGHASIVAKVFKLPVDHWLLTYDAPRVGGFEPLHADTKAQSYCPRDCVVQAWAARIERRGQCAGQLSGEHRRSSVKGEGE
ncbi:hypothetical protein K437DRAFT_284187 [Tilletiaria anomala UBC 951]|uniref:Uncharacterized protein n=1 Tax=Tilletiaria anomala (strain ATCC 24038 / CBS 436.72 / UBC 951) TaxID=1037660 RepID=A0A066WA72_TILAU|nr:uncharacterized protein K437DRAFT_284187 [Tilletiaria anomala UBC 951]KDN47974.1 hypothetical protein K437DRAFT_284187 [Tilletiaria anomala UBC 951]